jgi:hypothetical protein
MKRKVFIFLICSLLTFSLIFTPIEASPLRSENKITFLVKASSRSALHSTLEVQSEQMIKLLLKKEAWKPYHHLPVTDAYLTMEYKGVTQMYAVMDSWDLVDLQSRKILHLPLWFQNRVKYYIDTLRSNHYGKMLPWREVNNIIPNKSKFKVIDLETGLSFNVQRRAGNRHADVQPLTYEDTKIMKQIYNGKWSWKRRSVLVKKQDIMVAASMHGMPHGGGALRNGFPGHFCIHFMESMTHRSKTMDPQHRVMVFKAAGKLNDYFTTATPSAIVDVFLLALNQQDPHLLKMTFSQNESDPIDRFIGKTELIEGIYRTTRLTENDQSNLMASEISVGVTFYTKGQKRQRETITLLLKRSSLTDRWGIDLNSLYDDF